MRIPLIKLVIVKESAWRTSLEQSRRAGEVEGFTRGYEGGNNHQRAMSNGIINRLLAENARLTAALRVKPRTK